MRIRCGCFVCLIALFVLAAAANGQPVVNAGADQKLLKLQPVHLQGSVTNLTPLDFWTGDGDNATENDLIKYNSITGTTAIGPLQTSAGKIYGWPSDFERINGVVYGIETFDRRLYTLNDTTGICTPVGAQVSYTNLFGLAYDRPHDKLYTVDQKTRKLLLFNRSTGTVSVVLTLPAAHTDIHGLAYNTVDGKIYYSDDATEAIYRVDLSNGANEFVFDVNDGPNAKIDEIDFFHGRLLCSFRTFDTLTGIWSMQLLRIDLEGGDSHLIGPVLHDLSAHSLLVNTIPERITWRQVSGPGKAFFADDHDPATTVTFTKTGTYVLELVADGIAPSTRDTVTIAILPLNSAGNGGNHSLR